jgi:hypothetical protein
MTGSAEDDVFHGIKLIQPRRHGDAERTWESKKLKTKLSFFLCALCFSAADVMK